MADRFAAPLPNDVPNCEAWAISDGGNPLSRAAKGLTGRRTIRRLPVRSPEQLTGKPAQSFRRLKELPEFFDAREMPLIDVHPAAAYPYLRIAGMTIRLGHIQEAAEAR